jgi:hypothetical protein
MKRATRDPLARFTAAALWVLLWIGVVTVVLMTWHPWVHPWTGTR